MRIKRHPGGARVWIALAHALSAALAGAAAITLIPAADTSLIQIAPSNSNGGQAWVLAGTTQNGPVNRGLFRFDLTSIPAHSIIQAATFSVEVRKTPPQQLLNNEYFSIWRMYRPWGEGMNAATNNDGGQGAPALSGDATWVHCFFPTNTWTLPGGAQGLDFADVETVSSRERIEGVPGSPYYFGPSAEMTADVQFWLNNPGSNYGWMLICNDESLRNTARRFGSREDTNFPPLLTVDYIPPPVLSAPVVIGNQFQFQFLAEANQAYAVQFKNAIVSSNLWAVLTNISPPLNPSNIIVTDVVTNTQRYYRVLSQ